MAEPIATPRVVREILGKVATDAGTAESTAVLHGSLAGLALKPAQYGGLAMPTEEFVSEICALAALDGSLGWLAAMFNAAAHEVSTLPDHAADVVWSSDPDAVVTTSHRGNGGLDDDQRLTGHWKSVIGAEYADWLLLPAGNGPAYRVLLPRSAACIEPVRDPAGLDAAGICDVVVSGAAVDGGHVFTGDRARAARIAVAAAAAAVVGSADGVWRHHIGAVRARLATSYGGDELTDAASAQVAWAASDIDAAKLQITESLHQADDLATGTWVYQQAVARARGAADRLLGNSRHALNASDPATRLWRDVHAGCRLARFLDAL